MKIKKNLTKVLSLMLALIMIMSITVTANAAETDDDLMEFALSAAINQTIFAKIQNEGIEGSTILGSDAYLEGAGVSTDWTAVTLGRFSTSDGKSVIYNYNDGSGYTDYLSALEKYVSETYAENNGFLSTSRPTEWHRIIMAVLSCGGDPTAFGTYNGKPINLVADGTYNSLVDFDTQGLNSLVWGLLALDTANYKIPEDAKYPKDKFVEKILASQVTNGGWAYFGDEADPDMTSMVIMALAPFYGENKDVTTAVDKAVQILSAMQNDSGDFSSFGTANSMTTAQILMALTSININPITDSRFITKSGNTILDGLFAYSLEDGGFRYSLAENDNKYSGFASEQVLQSLVACLRFVRGQTSFYDFSDTYGLKAASFGDVNCDGYVNITDATALQKHLAEIEYLSDNGFSLADVNNDWSVDIKDVTQIQINIAK